MAVAAVPMRVGGVELLVEVVQVAGSEPTSRADAARDRVVDAFDRAQDAIVAVATSTVETAGELARRAAAPEQIEVEFGIKFSVQGNVIVAGGSGEATLTVRLTYARGAGAGPRIVPAADDPAPAADDTAPAAG
ncbi:CU044_2847 family protein [Plantactinospora sp. WMMB782]|uniref:CU044_2847 family protein n=1 Tax=Plantactinospora sp. WMMB782 TaxID=3404121 RepID=UPI003B95F5C3